MSITQTNMANLRSNLADALDQVAVGGIVLAKRCGKPVAALIEGESLVDFNQYFSFMISTQDISAALPSKKREQTLHVT